ncbi:MAG: CopG family ribbon-helix-helix protein [Candidatus Methanomethyliaceae archaeon]|nr:CopG family ribbon-helix-helix protein [Candidatus Methanomethyliaceae archaeon]MDW7971124.1 CopG family ribbon-helix-helix protein [Nitrososphaerota archaeon]
MKRFSVSVPSELFYEFEKLIKRVDQDRSKAIQQAMRIYISEYSWKENISDGGGAIVVVYDHEGIEEITDLQHEFRDIINSSLHLHLDEHNCLEILAIRGRVEKIKGLIDKIKICNKVRQIRYAIVELNA